MFAAALKFLSGFKGWLYAALAGIVLGSALWLYWHGRSVGADHTEARYEKLLREAEDKARAIEDRYAQIERNHASQLSIVQADRDAAFAAARRNLQPVVLRTRACPAVPEPANAAGTADPTPAADERPLQPEPDIGPALLVLAEQCDRAYAVAVGWQKWWTEVSAVR